MPLFSSPAGYQQLLGQPDKMPRVAKVVACNVEGPEGVKWELGFAFFRDWEMGFCALGLGFMKKKTIENWEWDFNLSTTGWDCGI